MGDALKEAAQRLLEEAARYWEVYQRERSRAAVVWLQDEEGRVLIFTRGEYREQLMAEVTKLGVPTHYFQPDESGQLFGVGAVAMEIPTEVFDDEQAMRFLRERAKPVVEYEKDYTLPPASEVFSDEEVEQIKATLRERAEATTDAARGRIWSGRWNTWESDDGIRVEVAPLGGCLAVRGDAVISGYRTGEEAMAAANKRWPWVAP